MVGSISSIGIGSGLQLQDILDQLREVDNQSLIEPKQTLITEYEAQLEEFSVVENKLYTMKSAALNLSLSSNFIGRTLTSSNEDVLTATVVEGTPAMSETITVNALARRSSWIAASGASSIDAIVYVPTSVESSSGVDDPDADAIVSADGTLDITFGGTTDISVSVGPSAGVTTLNQLVSAIDTAGAGYVDASTFQVDGQYYLRIETATPGGTGEDNRVEITNNDTDLTLAAPDTTFEYSVGSISTIVTVAADTTLTQLVSLINDDTDNPGATASIIDDGGTDPYRLVLKADGTGENNRITVSGQLSDLELSEQEGEGGDSLNASFSIDGIPYQRQDNTFSDVFSGVTITLQGTGSANVTVASDDNFVVDMVKELVTAFNDVVREIEAKVGYDETTEKFGTLSRTTFRHLPFDLQRILTTKVSADPDGNIQTMFDLGMEFERDGTISIDETVLTNAVGSNAEGVQSFFLGDDAEEITGLADQLNDYLRTLLSGTGQVKAESDGAQARIDDLNLQIETETERLDKKYDLMTKQFIALDSYMNEMTSVSNYLNSQFDVLSTMWNSGKSSK